MNFKISFKTWLKEAKIKARIEQAKDAGEEINLEEENSFISAKKSKTVIVDIEVEHDHEYTTEEDPDDLDSNFGGRSKMGQSQGSGGSQYGSSRDLSQSVRKKDKDHLASFNKKMSSKLKERMVKSGGIVKQPTMRESSRNEKKQISKSIPNNN